MSYIAMVAGGLGLCLALTVVWSTIRVGISPMPSSQKAIRAMLDLIPGDASASFVELGSGWGHLAFAVVRHHSRAHVVGYELSWLPWVCAVVYARTMRRQRVEFVRRDFFDVDLSAADVVLCYLFPGGMERLSQALTTLKPGAVIISNTFRLPGWQHDSMVELDDLYRTRVYRYVVGRQ